MPFILLLITLTGGSIWVRHVTQTAQDKDDVIDPYLEGDDDEEEMLARTPDFVVPEKTVDKFNL